jgi:hypothetical protein
MKSLLVSLLTCCLLAAPAAAIPVYDAPETAPPTDIATGAAEPSDTSAVVTGYYNYGATNPPHIAKTCWFDYGTTDALGSREMAICAGTSKATLAPLLPGTTYYYRAGASNEAGTTVAPTIRTFKTLGSPPPPGTPPPVNTPGATLKVLSKQSRKGLRVRAVIDGPCPCMVRIKLLRGSRTIATLSRAYALPQTAGLTLKLRSAAKRKLRHARKLDATLRVIVTGASAKTGASKTVVHLRR